MCHRHHHTYRADWSSVRDFTLFASVLYVASQFGSEAPAVLVRVIDVRNWDSRGWFAFNSGVLICLWCLRWYVTQPRSTVGTENPPCIKDLG